MKNSKNLKYLFFKIILIYKKKLFFFNIFFLFSYSLALHHFILILLHQFVSNAQPLFVLIAMLFNPLHVFFVKMDIIYILELVLQ
jgi:hypothetical protein